MDLKKLIAAFSMIAVTAVFTGCDEKSPEPEPPVPTECSDPNAITFDDGDLSFAKIKSDDPDSAQGELSIVTVQGNPMLKFVDSGTNFADGTVQKINFDGKKLLSSETLAKVRSIEMDVYADATSDEFVNDDDENVKAPGWIGGGGGAYLPNEKWYEFAKWEGGEYNFEMSGAVHVELKFLLADSGQCWDDTMDEATFQIMRWGAQNEGSLYIDNIVFKDANGNSLPIEKSADTQSDESSADETAFNDTVSKAEAAAAEAESALEEISKIMEEAKEGLHKIPSHNLN